MDFAQVEAKFKALREDLEAGIITEEQFKAQLEDLKIQDDEGRWWIIGYETGGWYYHDGEDWVRGDPPHVAAGKVTVPPAKRGLPMGAVAAIGAIAVVALYVLLRPKPPNIKRAWFEPGQPVLAQPVTVHWVIENAQSVELQPFGIQATPASGEYTIENGLGGSIDITIVASNRAGSVEQVLAIAVLTRTPTPTATAAATTTTSEPTPCQFPVDDELNAAWEQETFGCATSEAKTIYAAYQCFKKDDQTGYLLWRSDNEFIIVLYPGGERWETYRDEKPDNWRPPASLEDKKLKGGFGFLLDKDDGVADALGLASDWEAGFCARIQDFQNDSFILKGTTGCQDDKGTPVPDPPLTFLFVAVKPDRSWLCPGATGC